MFKFCPARGWCYVLLYGPCGHAWPPDDSAPCRADGESLNCLPISCSRVVYDQDPPAQNILDYHGPLLWKPDGKGGWVPVADMADTDWGSKMGGTCR